jgi:hypothetical protein
VTRAPILNQQMVLLWPWETKIENIYLFISSHCKKFK